MQAAVKNRGESKFGSGTQRNESTLPLTAVAGHIPTCMQDNAMSAYEKKSLSRRNTIVGYQQNEDTYWRQY